MSDLADAARLVDALVSHRCGLVTELTPQFRGPNEPSLPHLWNATLAHFDYQNSSISMRLTGGKGRTEAAAKLSALGEAMERYSAFQCDDQNIRVGRASENAITPPECVLYSSDQYAAGRPNLPWSSDAETSWVSGIELPSGAPVELPASLVYLPSRPFRREDQFAAASSNGLSTGKNLTDAVLGGAYEVIERDAFMIVWMNKLPVTTIKTPKKGCYAAQIIRHYNRFGVSLQLVLLPTDQAPYVVMAIAEDSANGAAFHQIGLGCDIDPVSAVDKAVFELCQLRPGMVTRMKDNKHHDRLKSYEDVKALDDHPLFHAIPANSSEFNFLTQTGTECDLSDLPRSNSSTPEEALELTVKTAKKTNARVAYAEITPPDIAPLGLRVVRVMITGLQPIHFGFGEGRLGGARLYEAPVNWGLREAPLDEAGLNQCPHPLA